MMFTVRQLLMAVCAAVFSIASVAAADQQPTKGDCQYRLYFYTGLLNQTFELQLKTTVHRKVETAEELLVVYQQVVSPGDYLGFSAKCSDIVKVHVTVSSLGKQAVFKITGKNGAWQFSPRSVTNDGFKTACFTDDPQSDSYYNLNVSNTACP